MATADYSPIVKAEWDDAGNAFAAATDIGEIKDDSEHVPELKEDEVNSRGEVMFAGHDDIYNLNAFDTSQRAALVTKWKADDRIDWKLTRQDGSTVEVLDVKPKVGPVIRNQFQTGTRQMFAITIFKFTTS